MDDKPSEILYTGAAEAVAATLEVDVKTIEKMLDFIILERKMEENDLVSYDEKRYDIQINGKNHTLQVLHVRPQEFQIDDLTIKFSLNSPNPVACIKFDGKDLFRKIDYVVSKKTGEVDQDGHAKHKFWFRTWESTLDERCQLEFSNEPLKWDFLQFKFENHNFTITSSSMDTICRAMRCWGNEDYIKTHLFCDDVDMENFSTFNKEQKFCDLWDVVMCVPWIIYAIPCTCVFVCLCAKDEPKLNVVSVEL